MKVVSSALSLGPSRPAKSVRPSPLFISACWRVMAALVILPATFPALAADCVPSPSGLVGWWPGEGNADDIVGANNGILKGGVTFAAGKVGEALSFDGVSGYVTNATPGLTNIRNSYTMEFWAWPRAARASTPETTSGIMGISDQRYAIFPDNYDAEGYAGAGVSVGTNGVSVFEHSYAYLPSLLVYDAPIVGWTHIAVVHQNRQATLYINGVLVRTGLVSGTDSYPSTSLGEGSNGPGLYYGYYAGLLDEVSIYSRALSPSEVQAIYNAGSAGKCKSAMIAPPRAATATATIVNGLVVGVAITDGGWGYTSTPVVRISGGGGNGATAVAVVSNGVVIAVNILGAGSGYTNAPDIFIAPSFIPQPTMGIAVMSLLSFTNLALGTTYQLQVLVGNTWSNMGAAFTAASPTLAHYVSGSADPSRYHLATTPLPLQAHATAQRVNGFVVGATVTSGGAGYVTNPAVTIVGGGGTNATAVSHVSGGRVTSITITDAGMGYTSTPTILIASPPITALWPNEVTQVIGLELGSLSPYQNYQLEFAPIIGGAWTNLGLPFTPTSTTDTQYLNVIGNSGYFRVSYVP
jgi:hypothetical protein